MRTLDALLVTGGCGFIGSACIRALFADPRFDGRVVNLDLLTYAGNPANLDGGVDPSRYTFVHGDIADAASVERVMSEHGTTTVLNFAAETHVDRSIAGADAFLRSNVLGTATLLQACRRHGAHLHQVSSDEVYGSLGATDRFAEGSPLAPNSPYAASKASADHLVRAWFRTHGVSVTTSRCSNNYGPCQFPEKLLPRLLVCALEGAPLPIYGDGLHVRDWIAVQDHVAAVLRIAAEGAPGTVWNVGADAERTNLQLVAALLDALADQTGRDREALERSVTFVSDRPGHDRRYAVDAGRLRSALGWVPQIAFDAGIAATVRWYLDHPQWLDDVRSGVYRQRMKKNV